MKASPAKTVYGYSLAHDAALALCIEKFGTCPFGCGKDGAPNCAYHVRRMECEPSKHSQAELAKAVKP